VSLIGRTVKVAVPGTKMIPSIVMLTTPVAWQLSTTGLPGEGDGLGVAVKEMTFGGGTTITRDVLPFSKTAAERGTHAYGLNSVGLERRGFTKERIRRIHHAYKLLLASKLNTSQALEKLKSEPDRGEDVDLLIKFVESSERGVIK